MAERIKIDLCVSLETPLCVGAGGTAGVVGGRSAVRDGYDRLTIPGSQVKGRVRHACEALARGLGAYVCGAPRPEAMCRAEEPEQHCLVCRIFGSATLTSPLSFNDLVFVDPVREVQPGRDRLDAIETIRPGIGVNRRRNTAARGLLFGVETSPGWHGGELPSFRNEEAIVGDVPGEAHLQFLLAGLRYLFAWGGGKSRGLGWGTVEQNAYRRVGDADWELVRLDLGRVKELLS
jgi:CRISPR/Cas system CSM-associated protein Csm3 (group 7 of RAMP superfamily)